MEHPDHPLTEARRYGYVEDGGVWLRPTLGQPARRIGQVKDTDDDALRYFAQRYEAFRAKVDELLNRLETADNQGSYLMKILHLQEQCKQHDGLGNYETLHHRLRNAEDGLKVSVARNREKNLATKVSLIQQAEALRDSVEWISASEEVKELRQAWLKTGPVDKELTDELETRFHGAVQLFFDRRKAFQTDRKALARRTVDRYRELVNQAETLKSSDQFEATSRQLKQLQNAWREVNGNLPKKQAAELWTKFRAANNHFFERLKIHIESQRAVATTEGRASVPTSADESLVRKRELANRAEALLSVPSNQAVNQAKALQAEWKQSGAVRGPESDRLWQRFMLACDKVFEMSALDYYLRKRQAEGVVSSPLERAQAATTALRKFIENDRQELDLLRDNLDKLSAAPANDQFRQLLQGKIRTFERKIQTKTELIALFSASAEAAGR
ncbi:MAG: DUF349 domain-containing protein [Hymenobacter sp.]|nr:MAG: DUF349 domain-containing protein [Hymenobacter sp.]